MKTYKSFASKDVRNKYICKSQIDKKLLDELGVLDFIDIGFAIRIFEELSYDEKKSIIVQVGNKYKRRYTRYVKKDVFYQEIISRL